jgi:hypothetical protein
MSTAIINLTSGPATLPAPYRGIIPPGGAAFVTDDMATVLAKLGGANIVSRMFRLEVSPSPANPANDPAVFTDLGRPTLPSVAFPTGAEIFDTTVNKPEWVNAAGSGYVDASGNPV